MYWLAFLLGLVYLSVAPVKSYELQQVLDKSLLNSEVSAGANHTSIQLSSIAANDGFTVLSLPQFPAHQVRVKKTDFCDPTVK